MLKSRDITLAEQPQRGINNINVFVHLIAAGLSKTNTEKFDPHIIKFLKNIRSEFSASSVRCQKLGWIKTTSTKQGSLYANIAFEMYRSIAPNNAEVTRNIKPADLLSTFNAFQLCFPLYIYDKENNPYGLDINRLFGLLEGIKNREIIVDYKCNKCGSPFIKLNLERTVKCSRCSLVPKLEKKLDVVSNE